MGRDRSLEEFLDASDGGAGDDAGADADIEDGDGGGDGRPDAGGTASPADGTDAAGAAGQSNPDDASGADPDATPGDDAAAAVDGDGIRGDDAAETSEAATDLEVRPARPTMAWTAGGADCEACGRSVERRWRDGERMVCGACKEW